MGQSIVNIIGGRALTVGQACGIDRQYSCGIREVGDVSASNYPFSLRPLVIVGFVGMVHEFGSLSGTLARGRLRGPKRRKPVYLAGLRQIEPRAMMALVGAFPSASRGRH